MATSLEIDTERAPDGGGPLEVSAVLQWLREQVQQHPLRSLAVAAGAGFVLGGGGLLGRATGKLVASGLRMGVAAMIAPLTAQLVEQVRGSRARHNGR